MIVEELTNIQSSLFKLSDFQKIDTTNLELLDACIFVHFEQPWGAATVQSFEQNYLQNNVAGIGKNTGALNQHFKFEVFPKNFRGQSGATGHLKFCLHLTPREDWMCPKYGAKLPRE